MDIYTVFTFFLIISLMVMSPGPNGALLLKTIPISGRKHGYVNVLGIVVAFYIHGTLSVFGLSAIIVSSASLFFLVKVIGALYLAYLGIKAIISSFRQPNPPVNSIDSLVNQIDGQWPIVDQRFGKAIGSDFVKKEVIGSSFIRYYYLHKFQKHAIYWQITFYKPKDEWVLNNLLFLDTLDTLFELQE